MTKTRVIGFDKVSDSKNNTRYIVYLQKAFDYNGETLFKKSSIIVDELPDNVYNAEVTVDWKKNIITKVEVK